MDGYNKISDDSHVTFTIKNPSKHDVDAFHLTVPLLATLADVQRRIEAEYDGNPSPKQQTLIYAGKVLKDPKQLVKDIIQPSALLSTSYPHSMHLVVRSAPAPVSAPAVAAASSQTVVSACTGGALQQASSGTHRQEEGSVVATSDDQQTERPRETYSNNSSAGGNSPGGSSSNGQFTDGNVAGHSAGLGHGMPDHALQQATSATTSSSGSGPQPAVALPTSGLQHMSYPYTINLLNPMMNSPVMATAYQAAYAAAMQSMRQQQSNAAGASTINSAVASAPSSSAESPSRLVTAQQVPAAASSAPPLIHPLTAPLAPAALLYYPAAYQQAAMVAAATAAAAASQQQQHGGQQPTGFVAPAAPFPLAAPFAVPLVGIPAHLAAQQAPAAARQAAGAAAAAAAAAGAVNARLGLQRRFPQGFAMARPGARNQQGGQQVGGQAAAAAGGAGQGQAHGHRRYRTRTITFRISMRTLLQMLVFGMVLYQHCTWPRLCILLFGSIILYITTLWPPFRQLVLSLARPVPPEQLAQMQQRRQQAAAQQQVEQPPVEAQAGEQQAAVPPGAEGEPAVADAAEPPGAGAAGPGQQQQPQAEPAAVPGPAGQPPLPAWLQQGLLREVLAVLVSFITSLFPAWNYNAEDAAVFAAAQEMLAREEQQQRQGQGQAGAVAANAFP